MTKALFRVFTLFVVFVNFMVVHVMVWPFKVSLDLPYVFHMFSYFVRSSHLLAGQVLTLPFHSSNAIRLCFIGKNVRHHLKQYKHR